MTYPPWVYRLAAQCPDADYIQLLHTITGERPMSAPVSQYTSVEDRELIANLRHANIQRNNPLVEEIIERLESALEMIDHLSAEAEQFQTELQQNRNAMRGFLATLAQHSTGIESVLADLTAASLEPVD